MASTKLSPFITRKIFKKLNYLLRVLYSELCAISKCVPMRINRTSNCIVSFAISVRRRHRHSWRWKCFFFFFFFFFFLTKPLQEKKTKKETQRELLMISMVLARYSATRKQYYICVTSSLNLRIQLKPINLNEGIQVLSLNTFLVFTITSNLKLYVNSYL